MRFPFRNPCPKYRLIVRSRAQTYLKYVWAMADQTYKMMAASTVPQVPYVLAMAA